MTSGTRRATALAALLTGAAAVALGASMATSSPTDPTTLTPVAAANTKAPGISSPNLLSRELAEVAVAQGSTKLENGTQDTPYYGYLAGPHVPAANSVQSPGSNVEAQKTEPDKNTYLVLDGQRGADPSYDYGRHFLFQGHEAGTPGALTRINLDADATHRVTLLATADVQDSPLPAYDGSTWDPWARRLLLTSEAGAKGGVWQATPGFPSKVQDISGALGRGGYEGIQNDSAGNVWVVEDTGGAAGTGANAKAKQPNSFLYRFVPDDRHDLTAGRLQVLQVSRGGEPITFHAGQADADITSPATTALHSYGHSFPTRWVTIHDTESDGTSPFDANALAKTKGGTPFKRPENGQFKPGSRFRSFYFTETGDTNADSTAPGAFTTVQRLDQRSPGDDTGTLSVFYSGDRAHAGFDNIAFLTRDRMAVVEDAGDTLHTQRNALDSGYLLDTRQDYSKSGAPSPLRFLAEGRDASATIDSGLGALAGSGFQNDGDNELTGIHVSDGDSTRGGILGAKDPRPWRERDDNSRREPWRVFYTAQHGDNVTWEIIPRP